MSRTEVAAFLFLSLTAVAASATGATDPVVRVRLDATGEIMLTPAMATALASFKPGFRHWKISDYSKSARDASAESKQVLAPYAVVIDANEDGKPDVILDGHDDRNSLIIGLVSTDDGYVAKEVTAAPMEVPSKIRDWNEGKEDVGLNHFFTVGEGRKAVFTVGYAQVASKDGELINNGATVDYVFEDGEFSEDSRPL